MWNAHRNTALTQSCSYRYAQSSAEAEGWNEIEDYGNAKIDWLKKFLHLPNGIPSHDTFNRVISMLDPKELNDSFIAWTKSIAELTDGEVIAIDGKCMRGSSDEGTGTYTHLVSAWASANNLLLAQEKVAGKSNEITAIPRLLRILELKNCIVTIDAMGCQREIARTIIERGARLYPCSERKSARNA